MKKRVVLLANDKTVLPLSEAILSILCPDIIIHYFSDVLDLMELLDTTPVDALITDLIFPNTDGERIAAYCTKKNPKIAVQILVDSQDMPLDRELHYTAIRKPVVLTELAEFLNNI